MKIATRGVDGMTDGVIDTEVEQEALINGIGIETLVITETGRGTYVGTTMGIAQAVGINPETDGNLGIEITRRITEGGVVTGILGRIGMTLAIEPGGGEKDLLTLGAREEEMTAGIEIRSHHV